MLAVPFEPNAVAFLEIDEEQPDVWVRQDIASGHVHSVAVVVREGQCARVQNADEPGRTGFV